MSAILEVTNLHKHFGGIHVTRHVNFSMQQGEQSAIIGPNAAGKSTFMNLLTGYHRCDAGKVVFEGRDITNQAPHRIARLGISRAFQVSSIFGASSRIGIEETGRVLALCGLEGKRDLVAGELAQGDKKRLELAIALAGKPRLLFLDEPTAGMSIDEARGTMELVDRLNRELGLTVLFTEHDMGIVFDHARKLTLMHRGEIVVQGTPEEVRANETAQKVYLGEHQA